MPTLAAPARVNLMPRSEVARRERDKLIRAWVWGVLGAILIALLIVAVAFWLRWAADQRLVAEQARTNQLLTEIASLAEVSQALATESELSDFRTEAMATDLAWGPAIAKVTSVLPRETTLMGFDLLVGGTPQGDDPAAEVGLEGTVNFVSPTPLDIVGLIRAVRDVEGVLYADGQSVTFNDSDGAGYAYVLDVQLDQTIYSGEYAAVEEGSN